METIPLQILEGLIHNVRTPLNLILGYAQHCRTKDRNEFADKIRNAGIRVDDLLQELWDSLNVITEVKTHQSLLTWLKAEQVIIHNCLQLKHRYMLEMPPASCDVECTFCGQDLSTFIDTLLRHLAGTMPHDSLRLMFEPTAKPGLKLTFTCKDGCLFDAESLRIFCETYRPLPYLNSHITTAQHRLELELILES